MASLPVSVAWVAVTKQHWLKRQKCIFFIFSHTWVPEVQDQGARLFGSWREPSVTRPLPSSRGRGRRGAAPLPSSRRALIPLDQIPVPRLRLI